MLKILWLDVETTGLDPRRNDVIQIAGILDIDTIPAAEFNYLVQPFDFNTIEEDALKVNGRHVDELRNFDTPGEVHDNITNILGKYIDRYDRTDKAFIGGQNPGFDRDFLKEFFVKNGDKFFGSWFDYHIIDLCGLSIAFHIKDVVNLRDEQTGKISVRLENVAKAFGLEQKQPHDALDDIRLTRQIFYEHMIDRFF